MKKLFVMFLSLALILGFSIPAHAEEVKTIDELLIPYQVVVDKVNVELGSNIYIPEENREKVYNNIKGKTPDEVYLMLVEEYKASAIIGTSIPQIESTDYIEDSIYPNDNNKISQIESIITPYYIREDTIQTVLIGYSSEMYLASTIFSTTGTSYIYESINSYGTRWPTAFTGYHFAVDSSSYSLSSNNKSCTVSLAGHPKDANGFAQALRLTTSHTFAAPFFIWRVLFFKV